MSFDINKDIVFDLTDVGKIDALELSRILEDQRLLYCSDAKTKSQVLVNWMTTYTPFMSNFMLAMIAGSLAEKNECCDYVDIFSSKIKKLIVDFDDNESTQILREQIIKARQNNEI